MDRNKPGYMNLDDIADRLERGKLNAYDTVYTKDTHEVVFIKEDRSLIRIKCRLDVYPSIVVAEYYLNQKTDTYVGQIVGIEQDEWIRLYNVNYADNKFIVKKVGVDEYGQLINKPQINGVTLEGNKTTAQLGIDIPTKFSQLYDDVGYVTFDHLIDNYYSKSQTYSKTEVDTALEGKADTGDIPTSLSDLSDDSEHRTVSDDDIANWNDKTKVVANPSEITTEALLSVSIDGVNYAIASGGNVVRSVNGMTGEVILGAEDVGALPDDTPLFSGDYNDLENKPFIPVDLADLTDDTYHRTVTDVEKTQWNEAEPNVQSDWEQNDNTKADYIKNKPTIPPSQLQSDWEQSDITKADYIKNKPTIPDAQIQSDWNQADGTKKDYIKNKPTLGTASALDVATSGNASANQVVKGNDTRLSDARTPISHTHTKSEITDFPTLGTASTLDYAVSGDASAQEVVRGNDSRLSDARTPLSHTHTLSEITDAGSAASKNSTSSVTTGSTDLVESGAVKTAIDNAVSSSYHHAGTKTCAELVSSLLVSANKGNVYNMTDSGTTTADFIEGQGVPIRAGDNVGIAKVGEDTYKFDLLSGFIDTSNFITKSSTNGLVKNDGSIDTTEYAPASSIPEAQIQSDWSQSDNTQLDYIKNKPTLGTASAKDVPSSGNASSSEVVMGNDTRLTDARNAADVYSWAKAETKPSYTASEVGLGNVDNTSDATKKSNFTGAIASENAGFVTGGDVYSALADKVDKVEGKGLSTEDYTTDEKTKLSSISSGAEVNVQSDWNQSDNTQDDYIKNKPTNLVQDALYVHTDNNYTSDEKTKLSGIASGAEVNVQSDWNQSDNTQDDFIKNKPNNLVQDALYVHTDNNYTSEEKTKLSGIASGAEVNVQSDWNQTTTTADDYIKNKPTIPTVNNATLTIQKNGTTVKTFTANASTDVIANITVPTKVSELTNDSGYTTNTGTVTSVATGAGLTGGTITGSGTIKAYMKSETKATYDSNTVTDTQNRQYAVTPDKTGYLSVNVPWENTWRGIQDNLTSTSTTDSLSAAQGKALNDNKVSKTGDTMTGQLYLKGSAASKPLKTRGIIGVTTAGDAEDTLHLQYGNSTNDEVKFGVSGGGSIYNNGTQYSGTANKATNDVDGNPIKTSYAYSREIDNVNLNSVTTPGFYSAGGSNTCTNKPSDVTGAFGMEVIHTAIGNYWVQILYANANGKIYKRYCTASSTWSSWTEVTDYTPTEKTKLSGISTGANKVQSSTTNGNIKIDGTETVVYDDSEIKQELDSETIEITGSNPIVFDAPAVQKSKDTLIHVKPFQDMNGYGNPYPAGGGRNLFPITLANLKAINTGGTWNGNIYTFNSISYTVLLDTANNVNGIYAYGTIASGSSSFNIMKNYVFTSASSYILKCIANETPSGSQCSFESVLNGGSSVYTIINNEYTLTVSANDSYTGKIVIGNGASVNITFKPILIKSTETDKTFMPYENTCPLIPRSEINIEHTGENLINPENYIYLMLQQLAVPPFDRAGFLFRPGAYTIINSYPMDNIYYRLIETDKTSLIGGVTIGPNTSVNVTVPNDKLLFVYSGYRNHDDIVNIFKYAYVGLTSYTDGFKEYNVYKKLKVLLGDDYYGGTLNLETGEFSVEYGYYTLTGNESMGKGTADQGVYIQNDNVAKLMDYSGEIRSDKLPTYGDNSHLNPVDFGCSGYADSRGLYPGQNWIYIKNINCQDEDSATTKANYKTWLQSANISIMYPLANPYTIQLSSEQLDYVKGINSVFTDNFDDTIDTTYREGIYATSEELKDVTDALNRTASIREGNPVYIESNVDQNAKSSNFTIEPVQDLHGWSKPWLDNTGKNKAPLVLSRLKSINTDGTWNGNNYVVYDITYSVICDPDDNVMWINANGTNSSSNASAYFYILKNEQFLGAGSYKLNGCPAGGSNDTYKIAFQQVNSSGAYITSIDDTGSGTPNPLTVSAGDYNCLVLIVRPLKTVSNIQYKPMVYLASETDASYEPYSNKCSIGGRTELPVYNYNNMIDMSEFNVNYDMDVFSISAQYGTDVTSTNRYTVTSYIDLYKGETINVKLPNTTTYKWAVFKYQSNGTYIEWTNWITNNAIPYLTATVGKIRIVFGYQDDRVVTEADKKLFMSFLSITRKPVLIGYFGFNNGTRAYPGNWLTTALLPCKPNTSYTLSSKKFFTNRRGVNFFTEDETFISTVEPGSAYTSTPIRPLSQTFTTPANAAYFNFTWHTPLNTPDQIDDLFIGTVRNTLTVKLGTTAYGGELDLENGRLVLDHRPITLPADTSKWIKSSHTSIQTGRAGYWCDGSVFADCALSGGDDNPNGVVMSYNCYPTGSTSATSVISSQTFAIGIGISNNKTNLWINVSGVLYPDVASWCSYLTSNPIQAYYPLATPIVYEISKENLKLFKGVNTITIDYGQMAIEYTDGSVAYLDDIKDFTKNQNTFYGTCATAGSTAAKVVTLVDDRGWELRPGVIVGIKFTNNNSVSGVTLNVNGSGAKNIWYKDYDYTAGTGVSTNVYGTAGYTLYYMYNGTYWVWLNVGGVVNTDANVTQTATTTNATYEVLFSGTADNTTRTEGARKTSSLTYNPSTKKLNVDGIIDADGYCRVDITGQTLDLNSLSLSAGTINETYYICKNNGGATNITHRPITDTYAFILDVKQIRWVSSSDFITLQTYRDTHNTNIVYERTCNTSTWSDWIPRLFTDQNVTQSNTTTSDWRKVALGAQHDSGAGTAVTTQYDQVYVHNNLEYQPSTGTLRANNMKADILGVTPNTGSSGGISLYNGTSSVETYGIMFRTTSTRGKHGAVQGDFATYFTMNATANRGWIYKVDNNDIGNVASINNSGHAVFNGSVTVGGNAANTSGAKMEYNSTNKCIDFTFN